MKNKLYILLALFVTVFSVAVSVKANASEDAGSESSGSFALADINEINSFLLFWLI